MTIQIQKLIERAEECLSDAEYSLEDLRFDMALNRAYYCVFDCVRALLQTQNIFAKTHQGTHVKFNEVFIKTNLWDFKFAAILKKLFEMRQTADYYLDEDFSAREVEIALENAREFLAATKKYFNLK
jgi:uncharacterized protein (UPF0332 family)